MQPLRGAPRFNPEYDAAVTDLLDGDFDPDSLWIIKQARVSQLRALLAAHGFAAIAQGAPYEGRVLLRVRRVAIAGH
jgi:hypothetical protein